MFIILQLIVRQFLVPTPHHFCREAEGGCPNGAEVIINIFVQPGGSPLLTPHSTLRVNPSHADPS